MNIKHKLALSMAALLSLVSTGEVMAWPASIDNFNITNNGSVVWNDNFSNSATAGAYTGPIAGVSTLNGVTIDGSGTAKMNPYNGKTDVSEVSGTYRAVTRARYDGAGRFLLTNDSYSVSGLFNVTAASLSETKGAFGIRLDDSRTGSSFNDLVALRLRKNSAGQVFVSFQNNTDARITGVPGNGFETSLSSAILDTNTFDQILLTLTHAANGDVFGSYALSSNGTAVGGDTFLQGFTMYRNVPGTVNDKVRASFFATQGLTAPVPEPSTWVLMIAGLGLLFSLSRRRA